MKCLETTKFVTKTGLIGIVKHLDLEIPSEQMELFKHCNTNWFCGYVIIPTNHPFYGKDYSEINIDVHGGLTYSSDVKDFDTILMDGWVFGFDCNHFSDTPEVQNKEFTMSEVEKLAKQLITKG